MKRGDLRRLARVLGLIRENMIPLEKVENAAETLRGGTVEQIRTAFLSILDTQATNEE